MKGTVATPKLPAVEITPAPCSPHCRTVRASAHRRSGVIAAILCLAAAAVVAVLTWQGLTEQGAPDPLRP
ncbi:MAG: hypothetical protein ABR611_06855, partial [Chthoniobacterales bacterium]